MANQCFDESHTAVEVAANRSNAGPSRATFAAIRDVTEIEPILAEFGPEVAESWLGFAPNVVQSRRNRTHASFTWVEWCPFELMLIGFLWSDAGRSAFMKRIPIRRVLGHSRNLLARAPQENKQTCRRRVRHTAGRVRPNASGRFSEIPSDSADGFVGIWKAWLFRKLWIPNLDSCCYERRGRRAGEKRGIPIFRISPCLTGVPMSSNLPAWRLSSTS